MGWRIRVRGQVQGVGFRPHVWQLAQRFGLNGEVLNDAEGVLIHCDAAPAAFITAITAEKPPLSRIDQIEVTEAEYEAPSGFVIAASGAKGAETRVTPDAATCPACRDEIHGHGRRAGYAFTNCTHCGPRFTILNALPYDRAQTTMAPFTMCPDCAAEYADPADRRFHAQPIACPTCGPNIWAEPEGDAIIVTAERILAGQIVAIKGLGGFHLCCDATNPTAIETLRTRKHRPTKPLALMATLDTIHRYARVTDADLALLTDPAAPIVLLPKADALPDALAPQQNQLGWMLPYTPLHHLLIETVGRPLVMTSGNLSGEPQVIGNDEAREKLGRFADAFLMHDRDIARRLDDSVERAKPPMILRRARGRVPSTIPLPEGFEDAPQVLALGGQMKGAICLTKNREALLGHHLGDLDDVLCAEEFEKAVTDYSALFDHKPTVVAVDAHPGYRATRYGQTLGLPVVEAWHHHAHLASCLAENGWPLSGGPVAGIILDGTGLGPDGTLWGGEVLLGDYRAAMRVGGLTPAPLAGGDRAAREPWRNAMARLDQAGLSDWADELFPDAPRDILRHAVTKGLNAPLSSSTGRLFDAVAAVVGLCPMAQSYEGEAAMALEALVDTSIDGAYTFGEDNGWIDPSPIWGQIRDDLSRGVSLSQIATHFHRGLAHAFADVALDLFEQGKVAAVALSGGCYQNVALFTMTKARLEGIPTLVHREIPANDGGLALGQAMIAAAQSI